MYSLVRLLAGMRTRRAYHSSARRAEKLMNTTCHLPGCEGTFAVLVTQFNVYRIDHKGAYLLIEKRTDNFWNAVAREVWQHCCNRLNILGRL
jgi:hypothetical protein